MSRLGQRLRELRGSRSINEVGRGARIVPIDISRYEQGKRVPTPETMKRLAAYFEIDYLDLRALYFDDALSDPDERAAALRWANQVNQGLL